MGNSRTALTRNSYFSHQPLLKLFHFPRGGIGGVVVAGEMEKPVENIEAELCEQLPAQLNRLAISGFNTDNYLAMLKSDYIGRASDPHELLMNG
jgi:hypothetical protein